jgi:hypothetical protein
MRSGPLPSTLVSRQHVASNIGKIHALAALQRQCSYADHLIAFDTRRLSLRNFFSAGVTSFFLADRGPGLLSLVSYCSVDRFDHLLLAFDIMPPRGTYGLFVSN